MNIDELENLKINLVIISVVIFCAIFLYAFVDSYECAISGLKRSVGFVLVNYMLPTLLVFIGGFFSRIVDARYFVFSILALLWFLFYTVLNVGYSYFLPF